MRFAAAVTLGIVALIPAAAATDFGTESSPELVDQTNDVRYDSIYLGSRDQAYLDIVSGWWEHDNTTDSISFYWKVADATKLSPLRPENVQRCIASAVVVADGRVWGNISAEWSKGNGSTKFSSVVSALEAVHGATLDKAVPIRHQFNTTLAAPGYFVWRNERAALLQFGDEVRNLNGSCVEIGSPAARFIQTYYNVDGASSKSAYSWKELRRLAGPDGAKDPIENFTESPAPSSTSAPVDTPAAGLLLASAVVAVVAFRRKH